MGATLTGTPVFLDRDGVIIRWRPDYIRSWADVELLPGALEALARLRAAGHPVAVVTNQSIIGRGWVPAAVVDAINARLAGLVAEAGGEIGAFAVCPHTPADGCRCRKPLPGLIQQAAALLGVDPTGGWMAGDTPGDVEAGAAAGCRSILLLSGATPVAPPGVTAVPDLAAAVELICG